MSPSRGLPRLLTFTNPLKLTVRHYSTPPQIPDKHPLELLRNSPHRLHIYRSTSTNPFFNLSLEDYLLRHSPPTSKILFTYTNSPSIILGRNQNIWSEVNIPLLDSPKHSHVNLVRRRSGGGTVYHDLGNLCWSVITPRKSFDRDFYAKVVVKALHSLGVSEATINERHDIVLRQPGKDLKVSGSAYKIIRERAYHHATLLLSSKLDDIKSLLRSPLKEFITTKGVESVRSEVSNIGVDKEALTEKIEEEFLIANEFGKEGDEWAIRVTLDEGEAIKVRDYIKEGMKELQSQKWLYTQTPEFTLSLPPSKPLPELSTLPGFQPILPQNSKFTLLSTSSTLQNIQISTSKDPDFSFVQSQESHIRLLNTPFSGPHISQKLSEVKSLPEDTIKDLGRWINTAVGAWRGDEKFDPYKTDDGEKTLRARAIDRDEQRKKRGLVESVG
ncbi:Biotin/lipoate A/B protein ligase [Arthrobotrys musiformis]|uniref:Putative lipoate-protein ligase A n=1 Tax=Arthrobotrys musiformis TaxID=47236 RepID=A0AAV9VR08_9PEZI